LRSSNLVKLTEKIPSFSLSITSTSLLAMARDKEAQPHAKKKRAFQVGPKLAKGAYTGHGLSLLLLSPAHNTN